MRQGEIFGLLGPNGAGKSTTVRIIVTLSSATSGEVVVDGVNVSADPQEVRRRIEEFAEPKGFVAATAGAATH